MAERKESKEEGGRRGGRVERKEGVEEGRPRGREAEISTRYLDNIYLRKTKIEQGIYRRNPLRVNFRADKFSS